MISICDVKEKIYDFEILFLLAPSVFNPTKEKLLNRAEKYLNTDNIFIYALNDNGEYKGIAVFVILENTVTILDIAVKPEFQKQGIGSKLIDFIKKKFKVEKIVAETDNDAVNFYKKYGFSIEEIETDYETERYKCTLSVLKERKNET